MVVADGDERPLGEVAQHLAVLGHDGDVEVVEAASDESRPGGVAVLGVETVHLVELEHLDEPVEQAGMTAKEWHHAAYVLCVEDCRLEWGFLAGVVYVVWHMRGKFRLKI